MPHIATTPKPPYYAVIFTSLRTENDNGYTAMAEKMVELAKIQSGFLGIESAREDVGITVSYWTDIASIEQWKTHVDHQAAQFLGQSEWYSAFTVRIAKVEKEYSL